MTTPQYPDPWHNPYEQSGNAFVAAYNEQVAPISRSAKQAIRGVFSAGPSPQWSAGYGAWYTAEGFVTPPGDTFWSEHYQAWYSTAQGWLTLPLSDAQADYRAWRISYVGGEHLTWGGAAVGILAAIWVLASGCFEQSGARAALIVAAALLVPWGIGWAWRRFALRNAAMHRGLIYFATGRQVAHRLSGMWH